MVNNLHKFGCLGLAMALPMTTTAAEKKQDQHPPEAGGRPNIIVILTDDMGYSDLGCYGGEIMTPNIDGLAQNGLRWTQFYNNARSCPSRAVLMTGLYPHQAGMGWMAAANMQGTDIASAINLASKSFTNQQGVSRAVFVITDGEDNEGGAVEAARAAAQNGIHVYVLGVGDPSGAPIPVPGTGRFIIDNEGNTVMSKLNEDMCREIANAGHGNYIYVDNSSSAQKKLDKYVENLGRTEMESSVFSEYDEQFQSFLLLSLLFLLMDVFILERENHILQRFTFFAKK